MSLLARPRPVVGSSSSSSSSSSNAHATPSYALHAKQQRKKLLLQSHFNAEDGTLAALVENKNAPVCPMCKETLLPRNAKRLPCGCGFHFDCIDPYLRRELQRSANVQPVCPTCRKPAVETVSSIIAKRKQKLLDDPGSKQQPMCVSTPRGRLSHNLRKYGRGEDYYQEVADLWGEDQHEAISELRRKRDAACKEKNATSADALFEARDAEIRDRFRDFVENGEYEFELPEFMRMHQSSKRLTETDAAGGAVPEPEMSTTASESDGVMSSKMKSLRLSRKNKISGEVDATKPATEDQGAKISSKAGRESESSVLLPTSAATDHDRMTPRSSTNLNAASSATAAATRRTSKILPLSKLEQRSRVKVPGLKLTPRNEVRNQDLLLYRNPTSILRREEAAPSAADGKQEKEDGESSRVPDVDSGSCNKENEPQTYVEEENSSADAEVFQHRENTKAEPPDAPDSRSNLLMNRRETVDDGVDVDDELALVVAPNIFSDLATTPRETSKIDSKMRVAMNGMRKPARRKGALSKIHAAMDIAKEIDAQPTLSLTANRRLNEGRATKKTGKKTAGVKFAVDD
ncbi:unnamed protein product [Amoebophrya sp. A120]|nr:unnamed protein product [Amoebophrya sp. A120]|eukprot:GSA120T00012759001.1